MMRIRRPFVAMFVVLGFLFAQFITALHACPIVDVTSQSRVSVAGIDDAKPVDCAEMAKQAGSTLAVCSSHCFITEQLDTPVDAPVALVAPQPALIVRGGS